jgi:CheY-like chemotaxis protein
VDLTGKRVLVVEDEPLVSMLIEEYLEELGCEVTGMVTRLDEAVEAARTLAPDVVLLDLNLDSELSYPVAEVLRERGVPFLFVAGYGTAGLPAELRTTPVLSKPFRQEQLAQAIRAATGSGSGRPPVPC